jgi:hypothetical protein
MAVHDNPRIVTNGLILCLDAANPKSYPGTGTTWYDISGNGNHFTLYNSPTFSDGSFSFDGTNDYANSTNTLDLSSYNSVTIETILKPVSGNNGIVYEHGVFSLDNGDVNFAINTGGDGFYEANTAYLNHEGLPKIYSSNLNTNGWSFHSHTHSQIVDSNGRYAFQDGQSKQFLVSGDTDASTATDTVTSLINQTMYLGSRTPSDPFGNFFPYKGLISSFRIYNRKLTLAEHRINFNAFRGRFGI